MTSDRTAVDSALHVCYAPPALKQLLVVTSSARLLKLDAHSGLLLSEVRGTGNQSKAAATSGLGGERVVQTTLWPLCGERSSGGVTVSFPEHDVAWSRFVRHCFRGVNVVSERLQSPFRNISHG